VLKIEATRFRAALNLQQHNLVRERPRRIAGLLLMLIEMSGVKRQTHEVHLTSQELARMAHCSRQSFYEAIKLLAEQGVVRQRYGYLEVLDTEKLQLIYAGQE